MPIDVAGPKRALENYAEIKQFVRGTAAEGAPIIPISAIRGVGLSSLLDAIAETIHPHTSNKDDPLLMRVLRSFDVNLPGASEGELVGGVIGGVVVRGTIRVGDKIDIGPGIYARTTSGTQWTPITATVKSLRVRREEVIEARGGGLVAVGTDLDPFLTKSNSLAGSVVSHAAGLPPSLKSTTAEVVLFEDDVGGKKMSAGEPVVLNIGTAAVPAKVVSVRGEKTQFEFGRSVCAEMGERIAISRRISGKWKLAGFGLIA